MTQVKSIEQNYTLLSENISSVSSQNRKVEAAQIDDI